jgi:hypothetical protein
MFVGACAQSYEGLTISTVAVPSVDTCCSTCRANTGAPAPGIYLLCSASVNDASALRVTARSKTTAARDYRWRVDIGASFLTGPVIACSCRLRFFYGSTHARREVRHVSLPAPRPPLSPGVSVCLACCCNPVSEALVYWCWCTSAVRPTAAPTPLPARPHNHHGRPAVLNCSLLSAMQFAHAEPGVTSGAPR